MLREHERAVLIEDVPGTDFKAGDVGRWFTSAATVKPTMAAHWTLLRSRSCVL